MLILCNVVLRMTMCPKSTFLFTLVVVYICINEIHSKSTNSIDETNLTGQYETGLQFVQELNLFLKNKYYKNYRDIILQVGPNLVQTPDDQQCLELLSFTLENPLDFKWTAELLDSSGSVFSPGTLSGTTTSFGDFDKCLDVKNDNPITSNAFYKVTGKYCFLTIGLPTNQSKFIDYRYKKTYRKWPHQLISQWIEMNGKFPFARSLCLPSVCQEDFVKKLIVQGYKPLSNLEVKIDFCQIKQADSIKMTEMPNEFIVVCLVLVSVFVLVSIGTFVDFWQQNKFKNEKSTLHPNTIISTFACFSLIANVESLFTVERNFQYKWVDGIRCIFTLLMLLSHVSVNQSVLQLSQLSPFARFPTDYQRQAENFVNRYMINSTFVIKTFFMMSGFLLGVNMLRHKERPSFFRFAIIRWLRFTPTMIGYIAVVFLFAIIGNGPLFHKSLIQPYTEPCLKYSWMQFLYINNWFDFKFSCGFQTWYVSADFQLHLLSYFAFFFIANKRWRKAIFVCAFFIALSYIIAAIVFAFGKEGLPVFLSVIYPQLSIPSKGYLIYWTATHNHLEAYFFGIIVGILVGKRIILPFTMPMVNTLWYGCLATLLITPNFFPWFIKNSDTKSLLDLVGNRSWFDAINMTFSHALWLFCFGWIFYAAATFYSPTEEPKRCNNLVIRFLSAPFLAPFARLSFCVYLMHVPMTWFNVHQTRFPQTRNEFGATQFVLVTYLNSLFGAIFLYLFFEAPFSKLTHKLISVHQQITLKKRIDQRETIEMGKPSCNKDDSVIISAIPKVVQPGIL